MPDFTYKAMSAAGARDTGSLTAGSEREALSILDARGLMPLSITEEKAKSKTQLFGGGVKTRHITTFYAQLADLLDSGVPLMRSLEVLERQATSPVLAEALRDVKADVADGTGLAESFGKHPKVFDELAVSMVKAGQEGGFLEDVLRRIADFAEHQDDLKGKVIGALAYPVFLGFAGFMVLMVLMVFFVPQFEKIFEKLEEKGELPALTAILMWVSDAMRGWGLIVVAAGVLGVVGLWFWSKTPDGRKIADRWKLRIPGAGRIYLNFALARFTRILGTLLKNGIPILKSLNIAKDSAGNQVLAEAIEQSAENITAGDKLAKPLAACPYFPREVVEMVSIAEESNSLDTVLVNIADGLEKRTSRQLELFVRLLEPVMLLFRAAITLVVVAGLLLPVFKMSKTVG